jgi:Phosphate-selective porin O and P
MRRAAIVVSASLLCPSIVSAQEPSPRGESTSPDHSNVEPSSPPVAPATADSAPSPVSVGPSAAPGVASPDATLQRDLDALREEVRSLRAEVEAAHAPPPPSGTKANDEERTGPSKAAVHHALGYEPFWPWVLPPEGISVGGYLQSQYESHQDSQDQLFQGGAPMNKNRFSVRRARVGLTGDWEYAAVALQLDANTTNGPQVDLRKAEASLQYRPDRAKPPILMATLGQFDTPFGYELVESPHTRWFMERSTASQAFWPAEPDLGARFAGALGFFRWTIALLNGEPLGEKSPYVLQDPNSAKDAVFRFGFDAKPVENVQTAGGISALRGTGFHAGTDATKSTIQWTDQNGNGMIEPIEQGAILGQAATPSQNFDRWAVGADLRTSVRTLLGVTKVYGEFMLGSNMDRGLYVADPTLTKIDQRELGFYAAVTQEIDRYGVIGFRFDYYNPNFDALDSRAGQLIPFSEAIKTYSPLIGLVLPERARLLFQYDIVKDALARSAAGVPTDLKNNAWTLRLQVEL